MWTRKEGLVACLQPIFPPLVMFVEKYKAIIWSNLLVKKLIWSSDAMVFTSGNVMEHFNLLNAFNSIYLVCLNGLKFLKLLSYRA